MSKLRRLAAAEPMWGVPGSLAAISARSRPHWQARACRAAYRGLRARQVVPTGPPERRLRPDLGRSQRSAVDPT
jgi:hypothetical protein